MAWVFEAFFDGNHNDLIEAGVIVVAAVLMFTMSGWLFLRQDPAAWKAEINRMAERAMSAGTLVSLAGIAFLAVFREGAETVLFLHALARTAGGFDASLFGGLAVAAVALAVVFVAMQWLALRLPLRPVFLLTSAFLFVMGLRMVGAAIQEFQEQVLLPVHNDGVPELVTELGFNGSWEALAVQGRSCSAPSSGWRCSAPVRWPAWRRGRKSPPEQVSAGACLIESSTDSQTRPHPEVSVD